MPRFYSGQKSSHDRKQLLMLLSTAVCVCATTGATAQSIPRIIDPSFNNTQQSAPRRDAGSVAADLPATTAIQTDAPSASFVLTDLVVRGAAAIDKAQVAAIWQPLRGKAITSKDLTSVGNQIAQLYADAGYDLVSIQVPAQKFAGGKVVIDVIEGHIDAVTIEGNTAGADLSLLKQYAAAIIADHPLRKLTLERYILLMNDIPGLKVGSRFEPIQGQPGAVRLILTILRSPFEWGLQVNNVGTSALGSTQATLTAAVNSVFQEGDQTQFTFGLPAEFRRYQYFGLTNREPIGSDGAALQLGGGYLRTSPAGANISGQAFTLSSMLSYPIIRAVHESLIVSGGVDMLNSNSALLGQSLADERTRNIRLSTVYGKDDAWKGTTVVNLSFSQSLDVLGARRGNIAYGGPTYTKLGLLLSREQQLPWDLIARARVEAQYSPNHLPNSEQLLLGGPYFGRAFDTAFLSGDRGLATSFELAHPTPSGITPSFMTGSEVFGYVDWGEAINVDTQYQYAYTHASSGGAGLRFKVMDKATVDLVGAFVINQPSQYTKVESPRFVFNFSRVL